MITHNPLNFKRFKNLYPFLKPYWKYAVGIVISLCLAAMALLAFGLGIKSLIDQGFKPQNQAELNQAVFILVGISVLMAMASFSRYYLSALFAEKVSVDLKKALFQKLLSLSPSFFENFKVGEILTRLNTDSSLLRSALGVYASTGLRSIIQLIGAVSMLFYTSFKLVGLVFGLIPFIIIPIFYIGKKVKKLGRQTQDGLGNEGAHIEETFSGIRTIQAFCRENLHFRIFSRSLDSTLQTAKNYIFLRACLVAYVITAVFAAIAFLLWIGGYEVIRGSLSVGDLSAFVFFGVIAAASINSILELFGEIQRALSASDRLFELLATVPEITNASKIYSLPSSAQGSLKIQDLTFYYPSRPRLAALNKISLTVRPGEKIALVGPSGSGKSTLLHLILRFYDPSTGGINLDEVDIKLLSLEMLRTKIGIVPQDPFIFNASIYANIAYGHSKVSEEEVKQAAHLAFATEFIETLPDHYHTLVGEKGVRLSGGQKQRLAIARVILKNPLILLLDEATNSLDAHSEFMVQKALEKLMMNRTTLSVAHRLSTVQTADRIIVLNEGKIVATGTHQQLMQEEGLYKKLAHLQFGIPPLLKSQLASE